LASDALRIHVVPHSHIDTEWYWTGEEGDRFAVRAVGSALEMMERDPGFRFSQDQVTVLEPALRSLRRDMRSFLRDRVRVGDFEVVGGMYVQPEVAEPRGECLIRQILEGKRWFRSELDTDVTCAWNIDTFGQCTQLPQILSKSGYRWFVFSRGVPPSMSAEMPSEFLYRSPDGSTITTHWMSGHYCCGEENVRQVLREVEAHRSSNVVLLPWGCDITYPREMSGEIIPVVRGAAADLGIDIEWVGISTPSRFFEDLMDHHPELPVLDMDFNPPLDGDLRGTYDNRIGLKKMNRFVESQLLGAEAASTLAWVHGVRGKEDLGATWRLLLYNHFHDIIAGSHHDAVYRSAMDRFTEVSDISRRIAVSSVKALCNAREDPGGLLVFNPSSLARSEICSFELSTLGDHIALTDGEVEVPVRSRAGKNEGVLLARALPAFGHRSYRISSSGKEAQARALQEPAIENEALRVEVDAETGNIARIIYRETGWEVLSGPGNELVALEEGNPDLEGTVRLTGRVLRPDTEPRVEAFEDELGSWVEVEGPFIGCRRVQRVLLWKGLPRVDFETELIDYQGGDWMIEVRFPLNIQWSKARASYETPFAVTERDMDQHHCAQTFVDCSDGMRGAALINGGTPGYWCRRGSIAMVLLRSISGYAGYAEGRRRLGLPYKDPDSRCVLAEERGDHAFRYSLYPHRGTWRDSGVPSVAHSFNDPPLCIPGFVSAEREAENLSIEPQEFEVSCIKPAGDDMILRGYDTSGSGCDVVLSLPFQPGEIWKADLLENPIEQVPLHGRKSEFRCGPHEIVTLLIRRAGHRPGKI